MRRLKALTLGLITALILIAAAAGQVQHPAQAAPQPQMTNFPTPTPGSDGRIVYIVKEGDTLWRIAAVAGMQVADLRDLNNLDPDDIVFPGQRIFLGLGGPAEVEPTQPPLLTEIPPTPTTTPPPGEGTLCVLLYEDQNGDSMRQEEEFSLPGGAINISNREGTISITEDTPPHNPDPLEDDYFCTESLEEGEYNVSVAIPEGYNPTTILNTGIELEPGDTTYLTFGAQASSEIREESAPPAQATGSSPILAVLGISMLAAGVGLGIYSIWFRNR